MKINKSPIKYKDEDSSKKNKNLDQSVVDNPPMKDSAGTQITENLFIGDSEMCHDPNFIRQNCVTHIMNTNGEAILNIYDPIEGMRDMNIKMKLQHTKQTNSKLIGAIKYHTITNWSEHKCQDIENFDKAYELFSFIEDAVKNYSSCLITSKHNKCSTVVVAIVYLLLKFKWSVHRTLEYINAKKVDIEITKALLKQL